MCWVVSQEIRGHLNINVPHVMGAQTWHWQRKCSLSVCLEVDCVALTILFAFVPDYRLEEWPG